MDKKQNNKKENDKMKDLLKARVGAVLAVPTALAPLPSALETKDVWVGVAVSASRPLFAGPCLDA